MECYKIEFIAKNMEKSYKKMIFWIDKKSFVIREGEMYDEDNELWKKLILSNIKKVGKYFSAEKIEMQNVLKGSKTEMVITKMEYDLEVNPSIFTERYLKK